MCSIGRAVSDALNEPQGGPPKAYALRLTLSLGLRAALQGGPTAYAVRKRNGICVTAHSKKRNPGSQFK